MSDSLFLPENCLPGTGHCPLLTAGLTGTGGQLTPRPEDFVVDEIPAYEPEGSGDHWFVRIRKTGLSTTAMVRIMAEAAGVHSKDMGVAGRKDEQAVTTQWISLPSDPVDPQDDRIEILEAHRHRHKLRRGHLKANRFKIRLQGVEPDAAERLPELLALIEHGVPNYFGAQRFGYEGSSLRKAQAFLARPRKRVRDPRFLVSVLQSALFNIWLGARLNDGLLASALEGDILRKRETGGLFTCDDSTADTQRLSCGELDVMGPLYGPKMMATQMVAHEREGLLREGAKLDDSAWKTMARFGSGGRRVSRVVAQNLEVAVDGQDLHAQFTLPSGCYATTVLAELVHPTGGSLARASSRST